MTRSPIELSWTAKKISLQSMMSLFSFPHPGEQEAVQRRREEEMAREEDRKARERKVKLKLEMQVGTC